MKTLHIRPTPRAGVTLTPQLPGDKSLAHRAAMLASLGTGTTQLHNFPSGADNQSTLGVLRALGIEITGATGDVRIVGRGLHGYREPQDVLDCGNSGTTMRMMSGLLAGQSFLSVLTGDASLRSRPMARVLDPLRTMGAQADGRDGGRLAPIVLRGRPLTASRYTSRVSSAQVKSCLILASLYAEGKLEFSEPALSRDHTERMLRSLGLDLQTAADGSIHLNLPPRNKRDELLPAFDYTVPADPSGLAFMAALAPLCSGTASGVGLNPTRLGFFRALQRAGFDLSWDIQTEDRSTLGEPVGTMHWQAGTGRGSLSLSRAEVVDAIDEMPVLFAIAATLPGRHELRHADELRTKESDRIAVMAQVLRAAGTPVEEFPDGLVIDGGHTLHAFAFDSHHDHRIVMAGTVLALLGGVEATIRGGEIAAVSFPDFFKVLADAGLAEVATGD